MLETSYLSSPTWPVIRADKYILHLHHQQWLYGVAGELTMLSGPVSISWVSSPVPGTLSGLGTVHLLVALQLLHTMLQYISSAVWLLCLVPGKLIVTLQLLKLMIYLSYLTLFFKNQFSLLTSNFKPIFQLYIFLIVWTLRDYCLDHHA